MNKASYRSLLLIIAFYLSVFSGAVFVVIRLLQQPSEPQNAFLWGYSLPRLILLAGMFVPVMFFGGLGFLALTEKEKAFLLRQRTFEGQNGLLWGGISAAAFCLSGVGTAMPLYRLGQFADDFLRLQPILHWLFFTSGLFLFLLLLERYGFHWQSLQESLKVHCNALKVSVIVLFFFILLIFLIFLSGLGIRSSEDYWYGGGIPILPQQFFFSLCFLALIYFLFSKRVTQRSDLLIFFTIWLIAALVWAGTPLRPSYFMPGPYFPNNQLYPYSDSAYFDLASQFALLGQGILNGQFFDRALYIALLVYLHKVAGQNYSLLLSLQAAIYAILPAILYMLGKELQGRWLGLFLAILTLWRGTNAILLSPWIDTSGPKMMMTDFPTAIILAAFSLFMLQGLKDPEHAWHKTIWAGGMIGLGILLRTNALLLIFLVVFVILAMLRAPLKRRLSMILLIILAMFMTTLPWDLRNYQHGGPLFGVYFLRIRTVFFDRYFVPSFFLQNENIELGARDAFPQDAITSHAIPKIAVVPSSPFQQNVQSKRTITELLLSVISHFLHNLVTSVFILPYSFSFDDLRSLVKDVASFWQPTWNGGLSIREAIFLALYLVLISLGIGSAWQRKKWIGLIPLLVFLTYNASNALARTSGGRYLVPMDWVVLVYFGAGASLAFHWLQIAFDLNWQEAKTKEFSSALPIFQTDRVPFFKTGVIFLALLAIGSLVPLSEHLSPLSYSYTPATSAENLLLVQDKGFLQRAGLNPLTLQAFLQNRKAVVLRGRALYPRFYPQGRGESQNGYPYNPMDYPRLTVTLIGAGGWHGVVLPLPNAPRYFPHAADVVVLGCLTKKISYSMFGVKALAIFVLDDENNAYYLRSPVAPLQCPVADPVCDTNHQCR
jgi:hypothetical protein